MESRMFNSTQNEFLRAKFLRNACFLNIREIKYLRCVPKQDLRAFIVETS
jgi:hypothetical protein